MDYWSFDTYVTIEVVVETNFFPAFYTIIGGYVPDSMTIIDALLTVLQVHEQRSWCHYMETMLMLRILRTAPARANIWTSQGHRVVTMQYRIRDIVQKQVFVRFTAQDIFGSFGILQDLDN